VRHLLYRIVDDDCELVRVQSVRAPDDEVADVAREFLRLRALQSVLELDARIADAYPPCPLPPRAAIRGNAAAAGSRIDALAAGPRRRDLEVAARAGAFVDVAGRAQLCQCGRVQFRASRLPHDLAVPFESVTLERAEYRRFGAGEGAGEVDVLDAHAPATAAGACVAIARHGRDERAEVQRPRRGGSETAAVRRPGRRRRRAQREAMGDGAATSLGAAAGLNSQYRFIVAMTAFGYSGRPRLPL